MKHLLVIDDDERLRDLLKRYLVKQGFQVTTAQSAAVADKLMQSFNFDLLIVDVMMPGEDGIQFVERLRLDRSEPVLMLTANAALEKRVEGFEAGVDDFLAKPFEPRELVLRIEAILRRARASEDGQRPAIFGDFIFDRTKGRLTRDDETLDLTRNERDVLSVFVDHMGDVLSREALMGALGEETNERNVDVTITRLRKKLEADPKNPHYIHTVRGKGYKLQPPS